ncbi:MULTISPECIES: hypothetical protein [Rhodococcus]|uniref:hypothetical protein n=1 Tax=Rhodococcus TaxID=1827 RepID=UPI0006BB4D05|nr:hypothetical protein GFS60_07311 [Rhodococcus sp. WAY2]
MGTSEIDLDKEVPYDKEDTAEAVEDADVSNELEQVHTQEASGVLANGSDLNKLGSVLETAGRGLATAIGAVSDVGRKMTDAYHAAGARGRDRAACAGEGARSHPSRGGGLVSLSSRGSPPALRRTSTLPHCGTAA